MTATATPTRQTQDATELLIADHKKVKALFEAFENADSSSKKAQLVAQICKELEVHMQIEEEIFYPARQGGAERSSCPRARWNTHR
jgi:hemerythrin superfamily protein